ncbi:MAG: tRNA glutamyl-Q(34) synthetase GluQRS [Rhodobacteraceae bacterium]|nr:tRNA glutamyl-Q(34) synthetase GluQRS [Paracoccaceae bacterium]
MAHIERFAPSPTGYLHLGHAFSALTAWDQAQALGGTFLLRIEDNDHTRVRPEYEQAIYDDLHWLGLDWPKPVLRQSDNMEAYQTALTFLNALGLTYACECTRSDIKQAQSLPIYGPDGLIYPGTCRDKKLTGNNISIRLNMAKAVAHLGGSARVNKLSFIDRNTGKNEHFLNADQLLSGCGDIVLARGDIGTAYHLAVVVDDAAQNVTHITRGKDLFEATRIHRVLQALLGLPTPIYCHHRLIVDENGKRLAKRDDSRAIRKYREDGVTPREIREMVGLGDE